MCPTHREPPRRRPVRHRLVNRAAPLGLVLVTVAALTLTNPAASVERIRAALDATHAAQIDNEMGTNRYAFLFRPGTYGSAERPLQIRVGYYTEIAGLGASPTDVVINGKVEVYNRSTWSQPEDPRVRGRAAVKREPGTAPAGQTGTVPPQGRTTNRVLTKVH
ncbi:hypothetical protein [Plantactinospora sp. B5E13]|uniref:hypothetical protein n=1 Tax=unclassified Plantactinospora TaxID=2631981 RepID=UPI00325EC11E